MKQDRPLQWFRDFEPLTSHTQSSGLDRYATETVQLGILCIKCRHVRRWLQDNWEKATTAKRFKREFGHHASGEKLEKSYQDGCHLCTHIWHSLIETNTHLFLKQRLRKRKSRLTKIRNGSAVKITIQKFTGVRKHNTKDIIFEFKASVQLSATRLIGDLLYIRQDENVTAPITTNAPAVTTSRKRKRNPSTTLDHQELPTIPIETCTRSASSFALARRWINECVESHDHCRRASANALPKRLLEVTRHASDIRLRLVDTADLLTSAPSPKYACLSYCWGGTATFKLTQSTTHTLRTGIPATLLPQTIRDAALTTLELTLSLLWVDSLCIIQDSAADWAAEAATMCDVYRGSFVTLAATAAASSAAGMFSARDPLMYSPCPLASLLPGNSGGRVASLYPHSHSRGADSFAQWPLHTRGWVVQERILPRRTLGFGPVLAWECWQASRDEFDFFARGGDDLLLPKHPSLCRRFYETIVDGVGGQEPGRLSGFAARRVLDLWVSIVIEFTGCKLTVLSDRCAALAGLVAAVKARTGWRNVAGVWETGLVPQLLWKRAYDNEEPRRTGLRPYWSWAAIEGGVYFPAATRSRLDLVADVVVASEQDLVGVAYDKAAELPLALRVSCVPFKLDSDLGKPEGWPSHDDGDAFKIERDTTGEDDPELFLPLAEGGPELYGIAVAPSSKYPGAFERVGYASSFIWENKDEVKKRRPLFSGDDSKATFILV
ncbi:heterokaryon incompatibility protein-domain-containing protein [Lasiosphaeria hispida]|uniref:Heterokaryon incompatibility protein-domain-containing protein n=1 Tax=Lasiosphaeria hispida TaxID=260671 RepID=A0AAJ0HP37_9PEZI|nr:heterokaryon incompatibility protein-domain-containing protein [Lasiosphaeria hispida]